MPVFGWALLRDGGDSTCWRLVAWALFVAAMITDKIDGDIARSRSLVTDFGKIADPIADKALTGMAFVGLSIIGELLVVGDRRGAGARVGHHAAAVLGDPVRRDAASRGGKIKTVLQTVACGLFILPLTQLHGRLGQPRQGRVVGRGRC